LLNGFIYCSNNANVTKISDVLTCCSSWIVINIRLLCSTGAYTRLTLFFRPLIFQLHFPCSKSATLSIFRDKEALISFKSGISLEPPDPLSSWDQKTHPPAIGQELSATSLPTEWLASIFQVLDFQVWDFKVHQMTFISLTKFY
jgi:hypothetical protein